MKLKLKNKEYPYTYARVMAMKGKLFGRNDYDKLQKMTVSEIIKFLSDGEYKKEIEKYAVIKSGPELADYALLLNTSNTCLKLKKISEPEVVKLIDAYLIRNDINNLKIILRGLQTGEDKEKIKDNLFYATVNNKNFFINILNCDNVKKAINRLTFLSKSKLKFSIDMIDQGNNLMYVENLLDHYMYDKIIETTKKLEGSDSIILDYLNAEVEAINLKVLLRMKHEKENSKNIIPLLIKPKRNTLKLVENSYDEIINYLEKTRFKSVFSGKEKTDLVSVESLIDKGMIMTVIRLLRQKPLSAEIIFGYLLAKEAEMRNIRLIIKAKDFSLPNEFIEKQLVIFK